MNASGARIAAERGSMTIEVAFLLVLLVVPIFYLVGTLGRVQAGAYAVTAAAREAGRTYVSADELELASPRAQAAATLVYRAHGFADDEGQVVISCDEQDCLVPGGSVVVDTSLRVPLPLVPDFMRSTVPTSITLTATHLESVDEFRGGGGR